jgi:hypothetical protein
MEPESSSVNIKLGLTAVADDVLSGEVAMSVLAANVTALHAAVANARLIELTQPPRPSRRRKELLIFWLPACGVCSEMNNGFGKADGVSRTHRSHDDSVVGTRAQLGRPQFRSDPNFAALHSVGQ